MRTIEYTGQFKREAKGQHRESLQYEFMPIVTALANDQPLPEKHQDHALTGHWKTFRDCHVKPDLVMIYRKPNPNVPQLVRLGSHSELGF